MSTLVIIGSSQTVVHDRPGGQLVFTPRHYEADGQDDGQDGQDSQDGTDQD
jgi:hypothetical protein